jgi:transposase InsO family protein
MHFKETVNKHAARYQFSQSVLKPDQSYADWVADLRGLATDCEFTCGNASCKASFVDDMIIEVVIRNTPHAEIRRQCIQDTKLTVENLIEKAENYLRTCKSERIVQGRGEKENVGREVLKIQPTYKKSQRSYQPKQAFGNKFRGCPGCFTKHKKSECPAKEQTCRKCGGRNHFASVCQSKRKMSSHVDALEQVSSLSAFELSEAVNRKANKIFLEVNVNGHDRTFQWDTGASCSLIGLQEYRAIGSPTIQPVPTQLRAYGGHTVPVKGQCFVTATLEGKSFENLPLLVVNKEKCTNLFGLPWADKFGLTQFGLSAFESCNTSETCPTPESSSSEVFSLDKLDDLKSKYPTVFDTSTLGRCTKMRADFQLKEDAKPVFMKARPLPFTQRNACKEELERLVKANVLEKIDYSDWAVPIVVVAKPQANKVRICGDFVQINKRCDTQQHPIPHVDDLLCKMQGGKIFSTLDMSDAYFQIELSDSAKKLCVINTPLGLYRYNRLPFGVSSAPAIFQSVMDKMVAGLHGVAVYLDDIIITGTDEEDHWKKFESVLERMAEFGFRVRPEKCHLMMKKVDYLGFEISEEGRRPSPTACEAVRDLPRPASTDEVKAFLGKIGYYSNFISQMSTKAAPLYAMLKSQAKFEWTDACERAFKVLKEDILKSSCLTHYDPSKQLILATDGSPYGVGAVLSQLEDGIEKPIAFASKTLTPAQRGYSQLDREGLAVIFGVTKFHKFLFGRKFVLQLDNKPLTALFSPDREIPVMTAQRITRWACKLRAYNFEVRYRPTKQHSNADGLSRLPLGADTTFDCTEEKEEAEFAHLIAGQLFDSPIDGTHIASETDKDAVLSEVKQRIQKGWFSKPSGNTEYLRPYWNVKDRLFIQDGIILLSSEKALRVVVPKPLRNYVCKVIHTAHFGIARSKQTLRQYAWWPGCNADIEKFCMVCQTCRENANAPPQRFESWPTPASAWERVHIDFAGPFLGKMWMIVIDAKSKFPFVAKMEIGSTTAQATIEVLEQIFAIEGICHTLVSDNGPQFTSSQFQDFCSRHGVQHVTSSVYHPASNGSAERFVATFKSHLKKSVESDHPSQNELMRAVRQVLFNYRAMPHPELDGNCPAEILHGRKPLNFLSLLHPQPKKEYSKAESLRFAPGSPVFYRNYGRGAKWLPGVVTLAKGAVVRIVKGENNESVKRHCNQLQHRLLSWGEEKDQMPDNSMPTTSDSSMPASAPPNPNGQTTVELRSRQPRRNAPRNRKQPHRYGIDE